MIQQVPYYLPKEYKNTNSKEYMHPDIYSSIIYNSQLMETAQMSINQTFFYTALNKDLFYYYYYFI